jgi:large subunit ribosomal protein L10
MPTAAKRAMVESLAAAFAQSTASIVIDYRGLTVADFAVIRRALRSQGITYRVVKNRLAKIAAEHSGTDELSSLLKGPSAIALTGGDEAAAARAVLDVLRPYRTVKIRGAVLGRRAVEADAVGRLATLPPRQVLLGQLAGVMASPLTTMAGLFAAPLRNLGYALQQVAERKAAAGGA